MFDIEDDDQQYLDNQDDDQDLDTDEDAGAAGDEDSDIDRDDSDDDADGGNLKIALKKERDRRKELERKLSDRDKLLERHEAILKTMGQGGQQQPRQQVDHEALRRQLQNDIIEQPDRVLNNFGQMFQRQTMQNMAPFIRQQALNYVQSRQDYAEVFQTPIVQQALTNYIDEALSGGGQVDLNVINEVMDGFVHLANTFKGGQQPTGKPKPSSAGKERLTSTVSKPNARPAGNLEEEWARAQKLPPAQYSAWYKKNKDRLNRYLRNS
jgi:hypothetical protein